MIQFRLGFELFGMKYQFCTPVWTWNDADGSVPSPGWLVCFPDLFGWVYFASENRSLLDPSHAGGKV